MPHLVGNDLVIGILHHIADFGRLVSLADLLQGGAVEENLSGFLAMGCKHGLQLPQKCGFAAAGFTAQNDIFTLFDGQAHTVQGFFVLGSRIRECQILDLEMCHWMASFILNAVGINRYAV